MRFLVSFIFLENYTGRKEGGERREHHSGKTFIFVGGILNIFCLVQDEQTVCLGSFSISLAFYLLSSATI